MAASVRSRLTTLAHAQGEEAEYVLMRYALERLLYRLGQSPHANMYILKGALLFTLWEGHPHRATRDLDLLGFGVPDVRRMEQVFRDLCMLPVEDDGLTFLAETVHARPIREQQEYGGIRVLLQALLSTARLLRRLASRRCSIYPHRICASIPARPRWPRNSRRWCAWASPIRA
jgi:Nucleotidyl transferase AbiEii toxin, Type IV TA system